MQVTSETLTTEKMNQNIFDTINRIKILLGNMERATGQGIEDKMELIAEEICQEADYLIEICP